MSSVNTSFGFLNLPSQVITVNTEKAVLTPASGFTGLPSPVYASGSGLCVSLPVGAVVEARPFKVRVAGKIHTGAAATVTPKLYQVPASVISAGTQATVSNDHAVVAGVASGSITGDANFIIEAEFMFDSTSGALNGAITRASVNNVANAANSGTAGTLIPTTQITSVTSADLNFMATFQFSVANAANSIQLSEYTISAS